MSELLDEPVGTRSLSESGWVRTHRDGAVLTVPLDRPDQLNAQLPATWTALADVGATLDGDVRVVVLRGEGRSFSAGLDRSMFDTSSTSGGGLGGGGASRHAFLLFRFAPPRLRSEAPDSERRRCTKP